MMTVKTAGAGARIASPTTSQEIFVAQSLLVYTCGVIEKRRQLGIHRMWRRESDSA
jgi:hypothetical protein